MTMRASSWTRPEVGFEWWMSLPRRSENPRKGVFCVSRTEPKTLYEAVSGGWRPRSALIVPSVSVMGEDFT